jgi:hypothetical protein
LVGVQATVWLYTFGTADPGSCDTIGSHFVKRRDSTDWVGIAGTTYSRTIFLGTSVAECLDHAVPFVTKLTSSTSVAWTKAYDQAVVKSSTNDWGRFTEVTAVTLITRYITTDYFLLAVLKYQAENGSYPEAGSIMMFLDWSTGNAIKSYHIPMAAPMKKNIRLHYTTMSSSYMSNLDYYTVHVIDNWDGVKTRPFKAYQFNAGLGQRMWRSVELDTSRYINRWGAQVIAVDNNVIHIGGAKGILASPDGFTPLYVTLNTNLQVIAGYELNVESPTAPWYSFDMIDFGVNWNAVLHASPRDANFNLMNNQNYNLYVTTRQDWGYSGANGCGYLNVLNLYYETTTSYFKLKILGTTYYNY